MSNGTGLKKKLCNPPAEKIAASGDPKVEGMFIGAGEGISVIEDLELRKQFESKVVAVEEIYMRDRKVLAEETEYKMDEIFKWVLSQQGKSLSKQRK